MRYIAEKHLKDVEKQVEPLPKPRDLVYWFKRSKCAMIFGVGSVVLYMMLYVFNLDLTEIAKATQGGEKGLFFVPILIAFVFTFIHGSFTSHFWEALGVQAKK